MERDISQAPIDDEEAMAVISAAVVQILSQRRIVEPQVDQDAVTWRFSGRWWNQPIVIGRSRPRIF